MQQKRRETEHSLGAGGFTLVELLVVIAIIGILSAVVLASLGGLRDSAKGAATQTEMNELRKALELYHVHHGQYVDQASTYSGGGEYTDWNGDTSFENALQPLVDENLIQSIPHVPSFPNNSTDQYQYITNGNLMDRFSSSDTDNDVAICGGEPVSYYVIAVNAPAELSLPYFNIAREDDLSDRDYPQSTLESQHIHCIAE